MRKKGFNDAYFEDHYKGPDNPATYGAAIPGSPNYVAVQCEICGKDIAACLNITTCYACQDKIKWGK